MKITAADSTATSNFRSYMLSQPTGTWVIHNNADFNFGCKFCGDINGHDYTDGSCWKCWRSRHPGALE